MIFTDCKTFREGNAMVPDNMDALEWLRKHLNAQGSVAAKAMAVVPAAWHSAGGGVRPR